MAMKFETAMRYLSSSLVTPLVFPNATYPTDSANICDVGRIRPLRLAADMRGIQEMNMSTVRSTTPRLWEAQQV